MRISIVILFSITFFFSLWSPTGSFVDFPKYWWDEAFTLEQARTFMEQGRIDFTIAPNTLSHRALTLSANGFPMVIPLAGIFTLFDVGITQARLYMLFWIFITVALIFCFLKKIFNIHSAIAGTLLVITFASFYANGRTATGDIPGFFFLLFALWSTTEKKYFLAGLLFALAAVTKTSLFHMVLPAVGITTLILYGKNFLRPAIQLGIGAVIIIIFWFALLLPQPYSLSDIVPAINFYQNPTHKVSLWNQLSDHIPSVIFSESILYFVFLFCIILYANHKGAFHKHEAQRYLFLFFVVYSVLQSIVFLRSPGWIRYLLAVQIFILMLLYPALQALWDVICKKGFFSNSKNIYVIPLLIFSLACMQSIHYIFFSNIFENIYPEKGANVVNSLLRHYPESTVGFVNDPMTAALVPGDRKYQIARIGGDTYTGNHPLDQDPFHMPTFMGAVDNEHASILQTYYTPFINTETIVLYKKIF